MTMQHKAIRLGGYKVVDREQGIVETLISVTGVVDEVRDRIIPGAYEKTLETRKPKGVWAHNWQEPVSKTLEVAELLPGDERLPAEQPNGEPWPNNAGAVLVRTQFNLKTTRGRDAFEDVDFFGSDQEWSIGFDVPLGGSKVDTKSGVREIYTIDLYEYSPVLWGAMPLARSLASVKDAQQAWKEAKAAGAPILVEAKAAIASHSTATDDGTWDGLANEARLSTDAGGATYRKAYAWVDPDKDADTKSAYRYIHHLVDSDGAVGAANTTACSTGIGVLNGGRGGTTIPDDDRAGVHRHLGKHLSDAGKDVPELKDAGGDPEAKGYRLEEREGGWSVVNSETGRQVPNGLHPEKEAAEAHLGRLAAEKGADQPDEAKDIHTGSPEGEPAKPGFGKVERDGSVYVVTPLDDRYVVRQGSNTGTEVATFTDDGEAKTAVDLLSVLGPEATVLEEAVGAAAAKGVSMDVAVRAGLAYLAGHPPAPAEPVDVKAWGEAQRDALLRAAGEKAYVPLTGSYEERQEALWRALEGLLRAQEEPAWPWEDPEYMPRDLWVVLEATYDDRCVACTMDWSSSEPNRYWEVPYTWTADGVGLGTPAEVRLVAGTEAKDFRLRLGSALAKALGVAGAGYLAKSVVEPDGTREPSDAPAADAVEGVERVPNEPEVTDVEPEEGKAVLTEADLMALEALHAASNA